MHSAVFQTDCEKSVLGEEEGRVKEDKRQNTGSYLCIKHFHKV